jgi:hypothetical protein
MWEKLSSSFSIPIAGGLQVKFKPRTPKYDPGLLPALPIWHLAFVWQDLKVNNCILGIPCLTWGLKVETMGFPTISLLSQHKKLE